MSTKRHQPKYTRGQWDTKTHVIRVPWIYHVGAGNFHQPKLFINLFCCSQINRKCFTKNYKRKKKAFKLYHWLLNISRCFLLIPRSSPPLKGKVGTWESLLTRQYQRKQKGIRLVNTHCELQHILYPSAFFKNSAAEFYARCWKVLKEKFSCPHLQ